uniref:Uncharacterized protein n=1 Tax=Anguilla anguilla TaxID=7936 RepID=A0A0E9UIY9_ANGAN
MVQDHLPYVLRLRLSQ